MHTPNRQSGAPSLLRRLSLRTLLVVGMTAALAACGGSSSSNNSSSSSESGTGVAQKPTTILMMGDSISSGWGTVTAANGWVNLVRQRITTDGIDKNAPINIVNTAVSGETAATAASKLGGLLSQHNPTHVWLSHGTNDAFKGADIGTIETRLDNMATQAKGAGAKLLFLDMQIHPNYVGDAFANEYSAMYKRLAAKHGSPYVYMFTSIYKNPAYFHPDLIHPNLAGQPIMRDNIWSAFIGSL